MAKYKAGDIVCVRSDLTRGKIYKMENSKEEDGIVSSMFKKRGKKVEIEYYSEVFGKYNIKGNSSW